MKLPCTYKNNSMLTVQSMCMSDMTMSTMAYMCSLRMASSKLNS